MTAVVMRQVWCHLGFLHWPVDAAAVARLLPPGLEVDRFDGTAYLGLVPFTIPLTRLPRLGLPLAPAFHEANLRTYVRRPDGRDPGVWFFSLEAASRLAVMGARLAYGLPYFHARMSMRVVGSNGAAEIAYESHRTSGGGGRGEGGEGADPPRLRLRYKATGPVAPARPDTLEHFLIERYLLYSWNGRALRTARVKHAPYPLQPASAAEVTETLAAAAGLPPTDGPPPLVHYAHQVDVQIQRPRLDNPAAVR